MDNDKLDQATLDAKEAAETVKGLDAGMKDLQAQMQKASESIEEILRRQANIDKAMINSNEAEREKGARYSFIHAKNEFARGKNSKAVYWDDRTQKRFQEFLQMIKAKDNQGLAKWHAADKKAFGDNVQDNLSNWTPTEFIPEMVRLMFVSSVMLSRVTIVPMSRDQATLPKPSGTYTWGFADAGGAMTDSKFTPGTLALNTAKSYGFALINQEDLDDPAYPVAPYVVAQMAEDGAKFTDMVILYGDADGADAYDGKFDGWAEAASVNAVTGSVDASPTFAELLTIANIQSMIAYLTEETIDGAEFFWSPQAWATIRGLQELLSDGSGGTLASSNPLIPINAAWNYPLFGFPTVITSRVIGTPAASTAMGFLGNPKWIYYGDRMQMGIDTSEHYRFANDQVCFRAKQRFALTVGIPTALVKIEFGAAA